MPPVETEADRASFFNSGEFGQVAEIRGTEIDGYFDEPTELLEDLGPVAVQTHNPQFQCQTSLLPADLEEGEPIAITRQDGTTFVGTVVRSEPDGFGLSNLILQNDE